ncbi:MAG: hypothetical protein U0798_20025 [Gemmataceae bacterium]
MAHFRNGVTRANESVVGNCGLVTPNGTFTTSRMKIAIELELRNLPNMPILVIDANLARIYYFA